MTAAAHWFSTAAVAALVVVVLAAVATAVSVPVGGWWSCRRGARHGCAGENNGGRCSHIPAGALTASGITPTTEETKTDER